MIPLSRDQWAFLSFFVCFTDSFIESRIIINGGQEEGGAAEPPSSERRGEEEKVEAREQGVPEGREAGEEVRAYKQGDDDKQGGEEGEKDVEVGEKKSNERT